MLSFLAHCLLCVSTARWWIVVLRHTLIRIHHWRFFTNRRYRCHFYRKILLLAWSSAHLVRLRDSVSTTQPNSHEEQVFVGFLRFAIPHSSAPFVLTMVQRVILCRIPMVRVRHAEQHCFTESCHVSPIRHAKCTSMSRAHHVLSRVFRSAFTRSRRNDGADEVPRLRRALDVLASTRSCLGNRTSSVARTRIGSSGRQSVAVTLELQYPSWMTLSVLSKPIDSHSTRT